MKALYRMNLYCGKMGNLEGIFIADTEDIDYLTNHEISVYFGEVLGKFSEISSTINEKDIELITDEENVISIVEKYELENGYNPLAYSLCQYDTEDILDDEIDWSDWSIQEFIDFKRKGIMPEWYSNE